MEDNKLNREEERLPVDQVTHCIVRRQDFGDKEYMLNIIKTASGNITGYRTEIIEEDGALNYGSTEFLQPDDPELMGIGDDEWQKIEPPSSENKE